MREAVAVKANIDHLWRSRPTSTTSSTCPEGGRIRPRSGSDGAADRGTSGHGVQKSPAGLGAPQQAFLQSKNRKCIDTCPACQECVPS